MRNGTHLMVSTLLIISTAACGTHNLQNLRQTTYQGTPFQKALAQRYADLAEQQEKSYDWFTSMHFAGKGLNAAYGKEVEPEDPKDWDLSPGYFMPIMTDIRKKLITVLTPQAEQEHPAAAADAQVNFDCLVVYAEHNQQSHMLDDKIDACQTRFNSAFEQLGVPANGMKIESQNEETKATPAQITQDKQAYMVFFALARSTLTAEDEKTVDSVARSLEDQTGYEIVLNGHADTTGSQEYNLKLSNQRAVAVKKRLVDAGVRAEAIKIFAFGKSDPLIKTADGVPEPKNRVVEIFLNE